MTKLETTAPQKKVYRGVLSTGEIRQTFNNVRAHSREDAVAIAKREFLKMWANPNTGEPLKESEVFEKVKFEESGPPRSETITLGELLDLCEPISDEDSAAAHRLDVALGECIDGYKYWVLVATLVALLQELQPWVVHRAERTAKTVPTHDSTPPPF